MSDDRKFFLFILASSMIMVFLFGLGLGAAVTRAPDTMEVSDE